MRRFRDASTAGRAGSIEFFAERSYDRSEHTVPLVNIGFHDWLPGIANSEGIMIGEATYRAFVGAEPIEDLNATVWYLDVGDEYKDEDELVTLASQPRSSRRRRFCARLHDRARSSRT